MPRSSWEIREELEEDCFGVVTPTQEYLDALAREAAERRAARMAWLKQWLRRFAARREEPC